MNKGTAITEAIILAGGFGTRLQSVVQDVPKPMADINGLPFLHYIFAWLKNEGIETAILSVGYKHEIIADYFGENYLGIAVKYAIEESPLGTGGAIKLALKKASSPRCFVLNGDTYFNIRLNNLATIDAPCVIAAKELTNFDRYGTLEINPQGLIKAFKEKQPCQKGQINGGIYLIENTLFDHIKEAAFSFETAVLEPLSQKEQLYSILFHEYFMDIGIPEDYAQFKKDALKKNHHRMNNNKLNVDNTWTLFLDRDGVINERLIDDYVKQLNELEIIKGVPEAIKHFTARFGRIVVVTNQQGIGKGMMTANDLAIIHGFIGDVILSAGGKIDQFYFAPQLAAEKSIYRKPGIGMGLQAQQDHPEIDFNKCLMVGDSESDIEFGMKLGMKTVMLKNGRNLTTKADYIFENLQSVAQHLIP